MLSSKQTSRLHRRSILAPVSAFFGLLSGIVLAGLLLAGPSRAQAPQQPPNGWAKISIDDLSANWPRYDGQQKVVALQQLVGLGEFGLAGQLLARSETRATVPPADIAFLQGTLAKAEGNPREAIQHFRSVLAALPNHNAARMELAHALFQIEDDDNARQQFQLAIAGAQSDPSLEKLAQGFIDQIDKRGRLSVSSYVSVAPSTNINQAGTATVVYLNGLPFAVADQNRAKSGVGLHAGGAAGYRVPVTENLDIVPAVSTHVKRYADDRFNDTLINGSLGPRYRFDGGHIGLYATASRRWLADDAYAVNWGGRLHGLFRVAPRMLASADLTCDRRQHSNDWRGVDMRFQDGVACNIGGHLDTYLSNSSYLRVLAGAERERLPGAAHLSFDGWRGGVGFFQELPWGLSVYPQVLVTKRDFKGLFPGTLDVRHDMRYDLSATLKKRDFDIFGFVPAVQYTFTRNVSNVPFFDYQAHGVTFTLTKSF